MNNKLIVFGIVFLFIALVFSPNILATSGREEKKDFIEVEFNEYKADGSIIKNVFTLSEFEINKLKSELINSKTLEKQIEIYKKYGFVSQDRTTDELEKGMYEKASSLGITENVEGLKIRFKLPILLTFFKKVTGIYLGGISLRIGLAPFIKIFNLISPINLPEIDFIDISGGLIGLVNTKGVFSNQFLITMPGFYGMVGFVGYGLKIPMIFNMYSGFSVATFGLGLGLKMKEWNFNLTD